jgi:Mn2+/Fe2+ NRAMP family transporter
MKDITSQILTFVKEIIRKTIANTTTTTIAAATATAIFVIVAVVAADQQEFSKSKESAESLDNASQVKKTSR